MNEKEKIIVALTSVISALEKQGCAGIFKTVELKDGTKEKIDCIDEIKKYIDGNSLEFKNFKLYADSMFKNMTKDELISYIHAIYHNWKCTDIEKERFHKIICDLTNNQPYKFEDLKEGMWVWDDVKKLLIKIAKIVNETIYIEDEIGWLDCYCKFEEGRFYPLTKAMVESKSL